MSGDATRFGRYLLGERLATGGMGEVYLAVQTGIGSFAKPLALKLLLPHLAERPAAVEMFLEEARLAAQMHHANVAQIFDVGVESGRYFIAMELVRGVALSQLITALRIDNHRLDANLLCYIACALCDGLHHAHELADAHGRPLNLVHRDVTPHNVLVSTDGDLKLTDFGIARAAGGTLPRADERLVGKLPYLAPEQLEGLPVDRRGDLYSAAVTLYQLAALEHPAGVVSGPPELVLERLMGDFEPLAKKRPDLPTAFTSAIDRAVSKNAADRFPTARAWRNAMPEPAPRANEALGQLVRERCKDAVEHLDAKTYHAVSVQRRTEQLKRTEPGAEVKSARQARWGARALAVGTLLGAAGVLFHLWRAPSAEPAAAPAPAPLEATAAPFPEVDLTPPAVEVAAAASPPGAERPRRSPPEKARRANAHTGSAAQVGYVTIDADPWAQVYVAGDLVGETPLSAYPVEAGTVEVELRNPETGRRLKRKVVVKAGAKSALRVDLR